MLGAYFLLRIISSSALTYRLIRFCYSSRANFGVTLAGEFAASPNDCGLFLLGVSTTSKNPVCPEYDPWESFNATMKLGIQNFVSAQMDAFGDWFFWTWKVR